MKKILFIALLLFVSIAQAQPTATRLAGAGMNIETAKEVIKMNSATGSITPAADDTYDLGTASLEFQDAFFDGTVTLDALSMPISVVAGANTACSTTCTGFCFFGVNTASATADIVNCADATADECLCVE